MRDYQKAKVYRWEFKELEKCYPHLKEEWTLEQCREFASRYKITVKDGRGCRHARGGSGTITLPRWARHPSTVVHEMAHCFTNDKHGPKFMRTYIRMLARHFDVSRTALTAMATDCGIDVQ